MMVIADDNDDDDDDIDDDYDDDTCDDDYKFWFVSVHQEPLSSAPPATSGQSTLL